MAQETSPMRKKWSNNILPGILWNSLYYKWFHNKDCKKVIIINVEGEIVWNTAARQRTIQK